MTKTPLRVIRDHQVNPANDLLVIEVLDEQGAGGANHEYLIRGPDFEVNISFQNGSIAESGINGITQEALLAICMDRLRSFQVGKFSCRENALALTKIEEAMHWLHSRTLDRMRRGVEGKTEK